ncbi:hypothetical protein CRG98_028254 [Punica granatum]|uniref:Uncharacterized protein n=1 Tax=Punica granatum TaxID=22663 RepID=A0A2I0J5R6_PUNGR|nr:hypothetical protein CRG98_028254 [Punica granatum]
MRIGLNWADGRVAAGPSWMTGLGRCRTGSELGRGDLGCWAVGIWTGPRWASGPGLFELRVRRGSWELFSRGRAAGLGEKSS